MCIRDSSCCDYSSCSLLFLSLLYLQSITSLQSTAPSPFLPECLKSAQRADIFNPFSHLGHDLMQTLESANDVFDSLIKYVRFVFYFNTTTVDRLTTFSYFYPTAFFLFPSYSMIRNPRAPFPSYSCLSVTS